jgi:RNA polymerase sigma-70 factor (ECF subfamily)
VKRSVERADPLDAAVERMLAGDEHAFDEVYRAVQPGLLRYLAVLVGVADAEDVASETWGQAFRDLHRFTGGADGFRGWIATIGRHRGLDHLRARGRRPAVPMPTDMLPETQTATDSLDMTLEAMSTRSALDLIASLPPDQAEAVLLRVVLGLDAKAAAGVLGKRPGAVRTSAYRGLLNLGRRLPNEPDVAR